MSVYSDISKRIGWEGSSSIPSVELAQELLEKVTRQHCQVAFEQVFRIHRFAPTSETEEEYEAMLIIYEAYTKGTSIFNRPYYDYSN